MENGLTVSKQSENKSLGLALSDEEKRQVAVVGWQIVRELLPATMESDNAFLAKVSFLEEIIAEVGPQRFLEAVKQAIRISQYRSEVTIKRIRECAGLSTAVPKSDAVQAWELVTDVVRYHVKLAPNGAYVLEPKIVITDQISAVVRPVPDIPEAVAAAVRTMGGWGNLAEAYAAGYWGAKFSNWKDIFRP